MMDTTNFAYLDKAFEELQAQAPGGTVHTIREEGFRSFSSKGIPTRKNEEWKYTAIGDVFKKEFSFPHSTGLTAADIQKFRIPGSEEAHALFFINGKYVPAFSALHSSDLAVLPLEEAFQSEYKPLLEQHFGKSDLFMKDGIHALNTSFVSDGLFVYVPKGKTIAEPVYIYYISDAGGNHILSQPRSFVYVDRNARLQMVQTYITLGAMDSFSNEVTEIVVCENAIAEYYKIQNDKPSASQVGTTHIRQIGKSYVHTLVATFNGGMVRNNTNIIMETEGNEAHMYGLYLLKGNTLADNHTLVDNTKPNCFSNELYKGVVDGKASGVFNGKIYVRPDAQKTNAYQTNNNILLSDEASVNTKPQLEIFADDVKCSHGCTVGRLDDEALFYLRSRGISQAQARAMLLRAFAENIIEQIKIAPVREYAEHLIEERLSGEALNS